MGDSINKPLISVIVPVYKVEKYLQRCIDSILGQTYENLEIILVDDGSPDDCPRICDDNAARDSRIRVLHKQNGGQSDARNTGLEVFQGAYVMFVDSDDWIEEDYIAVMFREIQTNSYDMVISGVTYVFDDKRKIKVCEAKNRNIGELVKSSLLGYACNKLYRRDIIKRKFERIVREDMLFNLGVFVDTPQLRYGVVDNSGYNYYQRAESTLHSASVIPVQEVYMWLNRVSVLFGEIQCETKEAVINHIAYVFLTDSFITVVNAGKNTVRATEYIKAVFSSLPQDFLKSTYASNKLYKTTWFAYKTGLVRIYTLYLRAICGRGK